MFLPTTSRASSSESAVLTTCAFGRCFATNSSTLAGIGMGTSLQGKTAVGAAPAPMTTSLSRPPSAAKRHLQYLVPGGGGRHYS
jgi:hypothetical protein